MSERPPDSDVGDDPRAALEPGSAPRTPRWIPALGIAVAILVILTLVALHLTGALGPGAH